MKKQIEYVGSCYIGMVGPENEIGECRDSIENILRRPGDELPMFARGTKGYETRQMHFERWLGATQHPFLLLLDHDMLYPPDTLERLRSHKLSYVSGYYLRRRFAPICPVWFKPGGRTFPYEPWTDDPERGKLHELGASGWGCILIHRDVALAAKALLKDELLILEDDMDVWPYDLEALTGAVKGICDLAGCEDVDERNLRAALKVHAEALGREWRVLRGVKTPVGSDIRFPFFAREAGYRMMGDPDVRIGHVLNYPLSPDDYSAMPEDTRPKNTAQVLGGMKRERGIVKQARQNLNK